ncbi:hypothetical protein FE839_21840 [Klebsiella indica]|uniref:Uncharacterized protein n=1 Tax=Klebsiella indica TaxID=2582917 RepID=A0A5R9LC66_9ENTR|nr:hypothetical protein FE839_21840 [Klebsiella indica]
MASHHWKNCRFKRVLHKKETLEIIFENRACQRLRTPYNAPPLTRNNGMQAAGSAGLSGEKSP